MKPSLFSRRPSWSSASSLISYRRLVHLAVAIIVAIMLPGAFAAPGNLDAGFNPNVMDGASAGRVSAIAVQPDGKIVIGGYFTHVGGVARNSIARINKDGTLDAGFVPGTVGNPGADNGSVSAVAVLPDGKVLVGGSFSQFAGQSPGRFVVLNADGSLASLAPNTFSFNYIVYSICVLADGKILVGGSFDVVNGNTTDSAHVVRLNADGTRDTSFVSPFNYGNHVDGVTVDSQGRAIIIGGTFTSKTSVTREGIARLNVNGSIDTSFNAGFPAGTPVYSVAVDRVDRILIGKDVSGPDLFVRLTSTGATDPSFAPLKADSSGPLAANSPYGLALQVDQKVMVGEGYGIAPLFPGIARVGPDGGPAEVAPSFDIGTGANSSVHVIAVQADGKVLVGGNFDAFNGTTRRALARLENDAATESLTVTGGNRVEWLRGGSAPEVTGVRFDFSNDNGSTWTPLGIGTRISGGWELTGLALTDQGKIRARGFTSSIGYHFTGSGSGIVESTLNFVLPQLVPGSANLWLAGHPDGTTARDDDSAPSESPVLADVSIVPGNDLVFTVSGGTHNGPIGPGTTGPDGGTSITHTEENGIGELTAPLNALVGVFLDNDAPAGSAPAALLNFGDAAARDYTVLQPGLRQPFFIGDGESSTMTEQRVRVPADATRLFLGSLDEFTNHLNYGSFSASIESLAPLELPDLPAFENFSIVRGTGTLPWTFSVVQTSTALGLTLRIESTLDPDDDNSWTDLPGGSELTRSGDSWTLTAAQVPVGRRYFRVVAEAQGYDPVVLQYGTSFLIEKQVVDTTPPVLNIVHSWVEKVGTTTHFKMILDPQDEVGLPVVGLDSSPIWFRSKLNTTTALPASTPWSKYPWTRGQAFDLPFNCTSIVIELVARDAAGNQSAIQRRTFKTPFPYSAEPNQMPRFSGTVPLTGAGIDCVGQFAGRFDETGSGDDVLQIDRTTGTVFIHRQNSSAAFTLDSLSLLTPNSAKDSGAGDFDKDGRLDFVVVVDDTLKYFHNDGVDGNGVLQFSNSVPSGLSISSITTVQHCAVGDFTGDDKLDVVITGTDSGGAPRIAVLINYLATGQLQTATSAAMPAGTSPGLVKLGDVNGDGWLDAVTVDAANNRLIVFLNKQDQTFGGAGETNPDFAPHTVTTGLTPALPAQALAVGDVTGDGRADAVVVMHLFASTSSDPDDTRDHQMWQLFDGLADGSLHAGTTVYEISKGPQALSSTSFKSDVLLQDMNGDRFPELIFTSQFEPPPTGGTHQGGVHVVRITSQLTTTNTLQSFAPVETILATNVANPHRLCAGRYFNHTQRDIALANGSDPRLQWLLNGYTPVASSKSMDITGGASTDSDENGTEQPNGGRTYAAYPGEGIDYTLTYANNTPNAMTNATIECLLPATVAFVPGSSDPGHVIVNSGTSKIIRWTETVPAGGSGVKNLRATVLATTKVNTAIAPTNTFKGGGKIVTSTMPKVTILEPLVLEWRTADNLAVSGDPAKVVSSSSDPTGKTVRYDEDINYFFKLTNKATTAISGATVTMTMPAGTTSGSFVVDGGVTCTFVSNKFTFTVPALAAGATTSDQLRTYMTNRNAVGKIITASMTAQRPGGLGQTIKYDTKVANSLSIAIAADKNIARPGDTIEYTVTAKNWSSEAISSAMVACAIPKGTTLLSARMPQASGNFIAAEEVAESLLPGDGRNTPAYYRTPKPLLFWSWASIPGGEQRLMKFKVVVGADVPTQYYPDGTYHQVNIACTSYNFSGTPISGGRIHVLAPLNATLANKAAPLPNDLLPKDGTAAAVAKTIMSADNPNPVPRLTLQKTACSARDETITEPGGGACKYLLLPSEIGGGTPRYFLVKPTSTSAVRATFKLSVTNTGAASAHNIFVHDVLPAGFTFEGVVAEDNVLLSNSLLALSHFYDAKGIELPALGEAFSDNNSSGKWEAPESYTDSNGNKKYDGISSFRSFDFWIGDLTPGSTRTIYYQVSTTNAASITPIISSSGGVDGISSDPARNGLDYTPKAGYYATSSDLHFPINGQPNKLEMLITNPMSVTFPVDPLVSRSKLKDNEVMEITYPYHIVGGIGLNPNATMELIVPTGYKLQNAMLLYLANPNDTDLTEVPGAATHVPVATGEKVTFALGSRRICWPAIQVGFDTANATALKKIRDSAGQTINPLSISATIKGSFAGTSSSPPPLLARSGVAMAGTAVSGTFATASSPPSVTPSLSNTAKDTEILVGRSAPAFVTRNQTFRYVIFVSHLHSSGLWDAVITMKVPAGCLATKASAYAWNHDWPALGGEAGKLSNSKRIGTGSGLVIKPEGTYNGTGTNNATNFTEIAWSTPKAGGTLISWDIGDLQGLESGVVWLEVKVDPNFKGDRIDDDSCVFRAANAMDKSSGPLGVVVLPGDANAQAAAVTQKVVEGTGSNYSEEAGRKLANTFALGDQSAVIKLGGADYIQLADGTVIIPTGGDRVMVLAKPDKVRDYDDGQALSGGGAKISRVLYDSPSVRIAVGPGTIDGDIPVGVILHDVTGYPGVSVANKVLDDFKVPNISLLGKRLCNVVSGGSGTVVQAGGPTMADAGANNANLIVPKVDISQLFNNPIAVSAIVAAGGGNIVAGGGGNILSHNGNAIVAGGGGNIVAGGGGNIVAAGGGNIVAAGGGNIVAGGGGNVVGAPAPAVNANPSGFNYKNSSGIVAGGGGNIVAGGGGNIVAGGGGNIVAAGGGNIVAGGGGNIVAGGGGNIVAGGGGN